MAFGFFKVLKGLVIKEENTLSPKQIQITPGGTTGTTTSIVSSQTTNKTITLPDATDTLVGKATTDTLTNKTIDADANTISNIENADIKAGAAIDWSKMANLTNSRALVSDGSGDVSASAVTATELGYLSGATSNIQDQLDAAAILPISLTTDVTGTLPTANGGTGVNTTGTAQNWVLSGGGTSAMTMSNTTTTGKTIDGSADEIQLKVQAHSTQTNNLVEFEDSNGNNLMEFAPSTTNMSLYRAANHPGINLRRANGTLSSPTVILSSESLGAYRFYGYSAAQGGYVLTSEIRAVAAGTWDSGGDTTDTPSEIQFHTTPDGTSTLTRAGYIAANGVFVQEFGAQFKLSGAGSTPLTWYEEGTWTPTINFSTSNGTATITTNACRFTRIGNRVFLSGRIQMDKGTASGNLRYSNLPYTSSNVSSMSQIISTYNVQGVTFPANRTSINAFIDPNTSIMQMHFESTAASTPADVTASDLAATIQLVFAGSYQVG